MTSYRESCDIFNRLYHRKEAGTEVPLINFKDVCVREGQRVIKATKLHTEQVLLSYGFTVDGQWPEGKELPPEIQNHEIEYIEIDPAEILQRAGREMPPLIEFAEGEVSKPETGYHPRKRKRRGTRKMTADEERKQRLEDYVLYIDTQPDRDPYAMIRHPFKVEADANAVVHISIDGDMVPRQEEKRVPGGKPEMNREKETVKHFDIRIETEDGGRFNITSTDIDTAYQTLLAYLLESGWITKYLCFYLDGEKKLKEYIEKYFKHWHYRIFLDFFHVEEKTNLQTSLGIKGRRVDSPWEEPKTYKQKSKAGMIKDQPQTALSRTYASIIKEAIFYGNIEEAKDYIRHIPPEDIQQKKDLERLINYFSDRDTMLTCYALRKSAGLKNSSNSSELCNELIISARQKVDDRMHWCEKGSAAIAALSALILNGQSDEWFYTRQIVFKPYYVEPTPIRQSHSNSQSA